MLKNYLKLTWRNLARNSTYSIIIISGLVLAYSACLVIFLFVDNETSYDRLSPDADRMYRVVHNRVSDDGSSIPDATSPAALAPVLAQNISQIETSIRILPTWGVRALVTSGSKSFYEPRIMGADTNMISFFGLKVLAGTQRLTRPNEIVITETIAKKYFGDENAIGKTFVITGVKEPYSVTAVVADIPANMHFHFDIIVPLWLPKEPIEMWHTYNYFTYIKLKEGVDIADVSPQIVQAFKKNRPESLNEYFTQPITDIHLHSKLRWELEINGDQTFVTIFITIGIFIFLIASVNYINLSIVQALNRSKEVGIRKVSGAQDRELIDQFLLESTLISLLSFILAVIVAQGVTPFINLVFNQHLRSLFSLPFYYVLIFFVCAIGAGVISGLYPAWYLSAFKPAVVLKGVFQPGSKNLWLRKSLVVFQFAISIALITGATLVFMQVDYLRSKELGFNKDQVIIVPNISELKNKKTLKEAFRNVSGVVDVGGASGVLGGQNSTGDLAPKGSTMRVHVNYNFVDEDYVQVSGLELVAGRFFTAADIAAGPSARVILNQKAVYDLGLEDEQAVGSLVTVNPYADSVIYREVVGVVKDFHFASLRTEIAPFAFYLDYTYFSNFALKINTTDYDRMLADLRQVWTTSAAGPFEYFFLDEQFAGLYRAEENFKLIFAILTAISIYIACSGLFAVASYFIKRRTKEIGIRKALGASVSQVTWLVSSGFLRMVVIANLIAWPATWLFMDEWLNGFAYRISMDWVIFAVSGILAMLIAVGTIGGQSVKAARSNPIQSLRNE